MAPTSLIPKWSQTGEGDPTPDYIASTVAFAIQIAEALTELYTPNL